jgi:hypothetical protein
LEHSAELPHLSWVLCVCVLCLICSKLTSDTHYSFTAGWWYRSVGASTNTRAEMLHSFKLWSKCPCKVRNNCIGSLLCFKGCISSMDPTRSVLRYVHLFKSIVPRTLLSAFQSGNTFLFIQWLGKLTLSNLISTNAAECSYCVQRTILSNTENKMMKPALAHHREEAHVKFE